MLSRQEYDRIVEVFLVELNHICMEADEKDLRALPKLAPIIDEYRSEFLDQDNDPGQLLTLAFAYLDEFIHADWDRVIAAGYEAHQIDSAKKSSD